MEQRRHKDYYRTNYQEDFMMLRDSDFFLVFLEKQRKEY